ncbi:ThiF family adenylyltransferase [Isoptericola sp. b441]|uniref:ThiF family adenylyltransferase n=1 Tax=Actinotalea lenta TaxID=3064654 RepID=A0ABT9DAU7_9CELL|nr:ThiF family adenylyltransferase [Isoptericola sp. b441]MDO8108029.1 ThiF family adenylyltransferase [Isoptericola sp. b441]
MQAPHGASRIPPLVDPGPALSADQVRRWSRHLLLPQLGEIAQRRLRASRVCVVGAGGLGAPVLLYLAAAGVGRLGVVDADDVELSNLQRQILHGVADVGAPKVASARSRVAEIDPAVDVVTHHLRLTADNVDLLAQYDLVVDGTDNFETRYLVNDACVRWGLPEVWGSVYRFDAQVATFWGAPPAGVPAVQLRDLFPQPPAPGEVPSCDAAGVLGALCGQVGSLMATEAVKLITGVGDPLLGRVLLIDALRARWTEVPLRGGAHGETDVSGAARAGAGAAHATDAAAPSVGEITAPELAGLLADGSVTVVDVREPMEREIASLPGALPLPMGELVRDPAAVPADRPVVLMCHHGVRSVQAALHLVAHGRTGVRHLVGGIDAWSLTVDPSVPRY